MFDAVIMTAILIMTGADGAAPSRYVNIRCFLTGGRRAVAAGGVRRVVMRIAVIMTGTVVKMM